MTLIVSITNILQLEQSLVKPSNILMPFVQDPDRYEHNVAIISTGTLCITCTYMNNCGM